MKLFLIRIVAAALFIASLLLMVVQNRYYETFTSSDMGIVSLVFSNSFILPSLSVFLMVLFIYVSWPFGKGDER